VHYIFYPMIKQVICILLVLYTSFAYASDNPFRVDRVEVYSESDSLDNATREAVNLGVHNAFVDMLKRLMPSSMLWKINNINKAEIYDLVDDRIVETERMTSTSYMATISFIFNERKVKNILNRLGAHYADEFTDRKLIIPILKVDGKTYLWGKDDWMKAWSSMPTEVGLSRYAFALGDLEDITSINLNEIEDSTYDEYFSILEKYRSQEVVFIIANKRDDLIDMKLRILSAEDEENFSTVEEMSNISNDFLDYKKVAHNVLAKLDDDYKGIKSFEEQRLFKTRMLTMITSPKDWNKIRKKLRSISIIDSINVVKTNMDSVEFDLVYPLEPLEMTKILADNKLEIFENNNKQYLKLRRD